MTTYDKFKFWLDNNKDEATRGYIKFRTKIYRPGTWVKFLSSNPNLIIESTEVKNMLMAVDAAQLFDRAIKEVQPKASNREFIDDGLGDSVDELLLEAARNHQLVMVKGSNPTVFVFQNTTTGRRATFSDANVKELVSAKEWMEFKQSSKIRDMKFEPFKNHMGLRYINTYLPPEWRDWLRDNQETPAHYPESYKAYFEFLFPEQASREVVFRWLTRSLTVRAQEYLVLCGVQGCGKTIFADTFLKSMHGLDNYIKGKDDFVTNHFTGFLDKKTLVFIDEFSVFNAKQTDVLKDRINDSIMIEGKGSDQKNIINSSSFVLATNYENAIHLDPIASRRFSVPELTDKNLTKTFGEDWIMDLVKDLEDTKFNSGFYIWLLENYADIPKFEYWHGATFERICKESANPGMRYVLKKIFEKDQKIIPIGQLIKGFREEMKHIGRGYRIPSEQYLQQFFDNFTWEGKLIAKVYGGEIHPINDFEVCTDFDELV